jgi:hypothetical protein
MEISLLKRHGRTVILAALAAATAVVMFALMSASGQKLATAKAASHKAPVAHKAADADTVQSGDQTTPDTGPATPEPAGAAKAKASAAEPTTGADPAGDPSASGPDTGGANDPAGNSQAGGPDPAGSSGESGTDTETGPGEPPAGAGATGNDNCTGNCVQ